MCGAHGEVNANLATRSWPLHYKARIYSPTLGRFLQTDPIGYEDQYNLYAYVGNDPVNLIDPTGESDLNLFAKNDPLYQAGRDFEPRNEVPGLFTITGHGSAAGIRDSRENGSGEVLTPKELANLARQNGHTPGMTILLTACNCGVKNYALELAEETQSLVIAADGFVFFPSTNKGYVSDGRPITLTVGGSRNPRAPRTGTFHVFRPNDESRASGEEGDFDSATFNGRTVIFFQHESGKGHPRGPVNRR